MTALNTESPRLALGADVASRLAIATTGKVSEVQFNGVVFLLEKIEQLCNNSRGPLPPQLTKNRIWEKAFAGAFALRFGVHYLKMNELNLQARL